ncbi:MAG: mandelate racemase/muconate lactonizing enzyme family protein [Caldilineaceae bacterium]
MRISSITIYVLESSLPRPFGWSQGWIDKRSTTLVRVDTNAGVSGWGEGAGPAIIASLAPLLIGEDPTNRLGLWQRMFNTLYNGAVTSGMGGSAISALDIALWDIAGQAADRPIWDLLGGRIRDRVAVYATGLYYTEGEFPNRLLDEARGYVDAGFLGMKTKVGGLSIAEDVKRVAALRDAIGPDIHLAVDANQAYNAASAIRIGERLADYDILWFEEPVNARDIDGYLQVKAALPMSIAGGEVLRMRYEFKDFCARRAFDIAQPDIAHVGGITEMRRVADLANSFGILVNPHVWASPVMIAATLHVASTIPPCPPARDPQPFVQEPVMEFDRTPSAIREELCARPFDQSGGYIAVPDAPGLGIEVDQRAVDRLAVMSETYT